MNHPETEANQTIRLFIGSSAKNVVEEKVFIYSLQKLSSYPIEINVIDGGTGSVRMHNGEVKQLPVKISDRMKGATAFSLSRYAIPQWCNYQGKAIYCDSDQLSLKDIAELWNYGLAGAGVAAVHVKESKSGKYYVSSFLKRLIESKDDYYLTSVMMLDCSKLSSWNIEEMVKGLDSDRFSYTEMMFLGKEFNKQVPTQVALLPSEWNHLDVLLPNSKIVHFTDLTSQPWLFHHNAVGAFWEQFFLEAVEQGFLSQDEIAQAHKRGVISRRIKNLPTMNGPIGRYFNSLWRSWSALPFLLQRSIKTQILSLKFNLKKGIAA